jgi:Tfp pilus assembly protein PilF
MMKPASVLIPLLLVVVLAGCQTAPVQTVRKFFTEDLARQDLAAGITKYEEGNHSEAARLLRSSLDYGTLGKAERLEARKHLAFIYCTSGRRAQCQDEFRKALRIDPSFSLAANEAGHPMWGPVFRTVKSVPQ